MRIFVFTIFVSGVLFAIVNYYRGLYALAVIEAIFGVFSIFLWRIIPSTPNFQKWVMLYIIPCFFVLMYALSLPRVSESLFVWLLVIPILSYLLMGRKRGFWVTIFFVLLGIAIYHWRLIDSNNSHIMKLSISINVLFSTALAMIVAHIYELNRERNEQRLLELAGTDRLTGLANRMKLDEGFQHYSLLSKRHNINFILVLFDLDFFKNVNDRYGHEVGDEALCFVADFLKENTRKSDLLARFGGEEFALLMTSSDVTEAYNHIESLRDKISQSPFVSHDINIQLTLSAGVSTFGVDGTNLSALMKKADDRLYLAKKKGRNCIVVSD